MACEHRVKKRMFGSACAAAIVVAGFCPALTAASYFVDSVDGKDSQLGTSEQTAWQTLTRVNAIQLRPGDSVHLKCGSRWSQGLSPKGSGTPKEPIQLIAYGKGRRPIVDGGKQPALRLYGQEGWIVEGLEFTNDKQAQIDAVQVLCGTDRRVCRFLRIRDCVARDSGRSGIHIGDANATEGEPSGGVFEDVAIEHCQSHGHPDSGIFVHGVYPVEKVRDVVIRGCAAHSNGWDGIKIYSARRGLIERCVAYRNGLNENARVGIWCWDSDDVVIQCCESYDNRTPGKMDGGGFDIDWSCRRCTIQYCYSHDNDGAGILFMGVKKGVTNHSCVRFNISQNDGRKNGYGGITCYGQLEDSAVYNNAVVNSAPGPGACLLLRGNEQDGFPVRVRVFNNIFIAGGERDLLAFPKESSKGHLLDFNFYQAYSKPSIRWADDVFHSLEEFQTETNNEKNGLIAIASQPHATKAGVGRYPMRAYRLPDGSPCIAAGTAWERSYGQVDYWGNRIATTRPMNMGPHQQSFPTQTRRD